MQTDIQSAALRSFFPGGRRICLIPSSRHPRLFFEYRTPAFRAHAAAFYPAFTRKARMFRFILQAASFAGAVPCIQLAESTREFELFMREAGFDGCDAVVMVGTPGAGQKLIVQVWQNQILIGYLKFALKDSARKKLAREAEMLAALPEGTGPQLIKAGRFGNGDALLISPVGGETIFPKLPIIPEVLDFLSRIPVLPEMFCFDEHPWVNEVFGILLTQDPLFNVLRKKKWPTVLMHGDFAPWNLIQRSGDSCPSAVVGPPSSELCAIDWENGFRRGFPQMDYIHYVLQVCLHVTKCDPVKAGRMAIRGLLSQRGIESAEEAAVLTGLCARWLIIRDCAEPRESCSRNWYETVIKAVGSGNSTI